MCDGNPASQSPYCDLGCPGLQAATHYISALKKIKPASTATFEEQRSELSREMIAEWDAMAARIRGAAAAGTTPETPLAASADERALAPAAPSASPCNSTTTESTAAPGVPQPAAPPPKRRKKRAAPRDSAVITRIAKAKQADREALARRVSPDWLKDQIDEEAAFVAMVNKGDSE